MIGELAALGSAVAFGLTNVFARRFMPAVTPEAGVLLSIVLNVGAYGAMALLAAVQRQLPPIHPISIVWFVLGGLAGSVFGRNLSFLSIQRIGASRASVIRLANVGFALVLGLVVLREFPRALQVAGIGVVSAGLWVSLRPYAAVPRSTGVPVDLYGVVLALASGAAFALGDIARRGGMALTPSPAFGAAVGAVAALVVHLGWSVFREAARWPTGPALRSVDAWASALCNTIAVLLLWIGLRHTQVAIVSVLYNLQVLVVLLATPVLLRGFETIDRALVIGTLLALAGTAMILMG
jgi:drug/metabolite transporter (DMT)-like permease